MKRLLKAIIVFTLSSQVVALRERHSFKVIGVVGSIGKTSTKLAIAQALSSSYRVQYQEGNYNDLVTVPLVYFGEELPSLFNPLEWFRLFRRNNRKIRGDYPYDIVVVELGVDGPGQMRNFARFGKLDFAVITAITPEHMEGFVDLKSVATEELEVIKFSSLVVYNADLINIDTPLLSTNHLSFGLGQKPTDYHIANVLKTDKGLEVDVKKSGNILMHVQVNAISSIQLYPILATSVISDQLGMNQTNLIRGIQNITPVSGRLRLLSGVKDSVVIDDTYNSSPDAVKLSLEALYVFNKRKKIAVLGSMNELGSFSEQAHREVGRFCDSSVVHTIVTLGADANKYIAEEAEAAGCKVSRFNDPYSVGEYLLSIIDSDTVVLLKGSQNGVFLEEAVKMILKDSGDSNKLVRQSEYWIRKKEEQFKKSLKNTSSSK